MEEKQSPVERKDIDHPYRRNTAPDSYRMRAFGDKASAADEYTGERVYIAIRRKDHVAHHVTAKTAQVDHIIPIDTLIQENRDAIRDGYLTKEDLREIANSDQNLAVTSHRINESKQQKSNFEYIVYKWKNGKPENITTTVNMLVTQANARAYTTTAIMAKKQGHFVNQQLEGHGSVAGSIGNTYQKVSEKSGTIAAEGIATGTESGISAMAVSGIRNIVKTLNDKKSVEDAVKDTAKDSATSFVFGAGGHLLEQGKNALAKKAAINSLEKISINQAAMVATTALTIMKYADGEISGAEAAEDMAMTGVGLYLMQSIGTAIGGPAGFIAASLTVAAIEEGVAICKQGISNYKKDSKDREKYIATFNQIASEAHYVLEEQKKHLEELFSAHRKDFNSHIESGFQKLLSSAMENDAEGIAHGIDLLLEPFHGEACFSTEEEFETFFHDPNAVLEL